MLGTCPFSEALYAAKSELVRFPLNLPVCLQKKIVLHLVNLTATRLTGRRFLRFERAGLNFDKVFHIFIERFSVLPRVF